MSQTLDAAAPMAVDAFTGWQPWLDGLIDAVCVIDAASLRLIAVNAAAVTLYARDHESLIGRRVADIAGTPEDVAFWAGVALGDDAPLHSETWIARADGRLVPVDRRASRIMLPDSTGAWLLVLRDLTDERAAEGELEKLVAELRATLESTADGLLVTDLHGAIRGCNQLFAQLWSLPTELLTERDDAAVHAWMHAQVADEHAYTAQLDEIEREPLRRACDLLVLRNGRVLERVALPQYGRGQPIGHVYSFRDITERLANAARQQLATQVFESSLDAIFVTDGELKLVEVNAGCERLMARSRADLLGTGVGDLVYHPSDEAWFERVSQQLHSQGFWEGELWHRRPDGSTLPGHVSLVKVATAGASVAAPALPAERCVGFFRDLSDTVAAHQRIQELAFNDALTGLPNRVLLAERVEFALAMAKRDNSSFALLFLDLDRFKHINDSLGHLFGDRVLVDVAERLKGCVRQVDTVARLGGDEFVMLIHHADAQGAEATARRVLDALARPFELEGMAFSVTSSIGIALYPHDGLTLNDLIKNADAAMYRVKERGRAGFRFYQRQMNVDLLARMRLDHAMRIALDQGHFVLHYQPQIDLNSSAVVGAEALLRWHDPELGNVPPSEFIPVAEETGFIVALGDWVLTQAVERAAAWHAAGHAITVAVNVSALQFQQADFVSRVAQALDSAGLPAAHLELELTESILLKDADEALQRLTALDRLGVRLAIDDFGTGYSSLGYLKRIPIRKLKIDRSFVKGLPGDESDAAIATAVIQLARALRLRVIAEGVETPRQREFLREAGCDEFQGFLVSPAVAPDEFLKLVARPRAGVRVAPEFVK